MRFVDASAQNRVFSSLILFGKAVDFRSADGGGSFGYGAHVRMIFVRMVCFAAALCILGAGELSAQSFGDVVSKTSRAISKTYRSAEKALTKSSSKRKKSDARQRSGDQSDVAAVPPIPERKPRAWASGARASEKIAKGSERDAARQPAVVSMDDRSARRVERAKPEAVVKTRMKKTVMPADRAADENDKVGASGGRVKTSGKVEKASTKASDKTDTTDAPDSPDAPKVDAWTPVEINVAQARCRLLLKQVDAVTISEPAKKKGPCGDPAPVKLVSVGRAPQVSISPPAVVNCQMVHMLHKWLEDDLQPLAKKHLGSPIIRIQTMSSYSCRNAYGRTSTRLSEHGRANALDIGGFVTANGKTTRLLTHWGPNHRDIAKSEKQARERVRLAALKAKKDAQAALERAEKKTKQGGNSDGKVETETPSVHKVSLSSDVPIPERASAKLGGPKLEKRGDLKTGSAKRKKVSKRKPAADPTILRPSNSKKAKFLRAAHKTACVKFGTVLGPEANEAHRNHFHVDLAPRKRSNYCR